MAIAPAPDARLGEVPAAFLIADAPIAAQARGERMLDQGLPRQKTPVHQCLPRQKTPVHWRFIEQMQTTAAGKIRKFELATQLATELATIHEEPS